MFMYLSIVKKIILVMWLVIIELLINSLIIFLFSIVLH